VQTEAAMRKYPINIRSFEGLIILFIGRHYTENGTALKRIEFEPGD
jgi:hypothetical protein